MAEYKTEQQDLTEYQNELLTAYAKNDMNLSKTAKKLYMHRNSLRYHFQKIREKTGLNPLEFYNLVELLEKGRRANNGDK